MDPAASTPAVPAATLRAIAFDLDGTLLDSAPDIAHALNTALRAAGHEGFDVATVRGWVGDGPDATIARALGARGVNDAPPDLHRRLRTDFDAATLRAPFEHGRLYDGIAPLLNNLYRDVPLVCVTNKPTDLARAVLASARLLPYLVQVFGGDVAAQRKPAPDLLLAAARACGVEPSAMLMVGDGGPDILAARAAGCPMALAGWGYGHGADAADDGVWRVASPAQLAAGLTIKIKTMTGDFHADRRSFHPDAVPHRGAAPPP